MSHDEQQQTPDAPPGRALANPRRLRLTTGAARSASGEEPARQGRQPGTAVQAP